MQQRLVTVVFHIHFEELHVKQEGRIPCVDGKLDT